MRLIDEILGPELHINFMFIRQETRYMNKTTKVFQPLHVCSKGRIHVYPFFE